MKKYLALVLGVLFTLGFAVSAFAITAEIPAETQAVVAKDTTQLTLGGELRFRGAIKANTADFNDNLSDTSDTSSYDGRVRIRLQADVSKNTQGVIHLESGTNTLDTYTWGHATGDSVAKGVYTEGNGKRGTLAILEAWILYKGSGLLGIPAGIKVGHMPLKLGNGLYFDHSRFGDDAIVLFADPTKELHIGLLAIKLNEGASAGSPDDSDVYGVLFAYKTKEFNLSGDVTYLDDQDYNAKGLHLVNYGLRADTKVGPLGVKANVEIQDGKSKPDTGTDTKYKGYAYLLGVDYKIGGYTLDLEYALGSGDGDSADNKVGTFVTALGGTQNYTYVYEYLTRTAGVTAPGSGASALGASGTGLANTTYLKLGLKGDLTKDLNLVANYYILRATKEVGTSTYNSKKIGQELDAKVTYKLDKNLVYFVEGGYLWAGDFYKNITAAAKDPDDAYSVRHGITLSF